MTLRQPPQKPREMLQTAFWQEGQRQEKSWLATWVNLALDENWSMEQRRKLVHSAADLYSRRGTKGGLIEYLKLYTGEEPEIAEYVDGMTLGAETFLGINTTIAGRERHSFTVTIRLQGLSEVEVAFKEANIRRIIDSEKPAHTGYRLNLLVNGSGKQAVATNPDPPKPSETPASNPVARKAPPTSSASPKPNSNLDNKRGNAEPPPAIG